jgi:hypothetical protein
LRALVAVVALDVGASNGNQKMVTKNSWGVVVRKSVARWVMVWSCRSVCRSASVSIGC